MPCEEGDTGKVVGPRHARHDRRTRSVRRVGPGTSAPRLPFATARPHVEPGGQRSPTQVPPKGFEPMDRPGTRLGLASASLGTIVGGRGSELRAVFETSPKVGRTPDASGAGAPPASMFGPEHRSARKAPDGGAASGPAGGAATWGEPRRRSGSEARTRQPCSSSVDAGRPPPGSAGVRTDSSGGLRWRKPWNRTRS